MGAHALRRITQGATAHIFRPDFIVALHERFGFVRVPITPSEVLGENLEFGYGKVEHAGKLIIVREFRVSPEWVALSVDTGSADTNTDDAEIALKEIADWATENLTHPPQPPRGAFASQLEVHLECQFGLVFAFLSRVGARLARTRLASHGEPLPPFEVISIGMGVDPLKVQIPTHFTIERRTNIPYEENVFFSQAPLKTQEHITLLEELEDEMNKLEASIRQTLTEKTSVP